MCLFSRIIIETDTRERGDQMETTAIMVITSLNRTDDGLYECIAQNDGKLHNYIIFKTVYMIYKILFDIIIFYYVGGEARRNGHLIVQYKPSFEKMSREPVWSWNARTVNLTCVAEGIPNATIKWK